MTEMQIKARYYLIPVKWLSSKNLQINNGESMEKYESLYTTVLNINWCRHYEKHYEVFSKN